MNSLTISWTLYTSEYRNWARGTHGFLDLWSPMGFENQSGLPYVHWQSHMQCTLPDINRWCYALPTYDNQQYNVAISGGISPDDRTTGSGTLHNGCVWQKFSCRR